MPDTIDFSNLKDIERQSRQGEYGAWRKDYLARFRPSLEGIYGEIRSRLRDNLASLGAEVSCGKGCALCCQQFISIPVSHALLITEYLYASEPAMTTFKKGYARWRRAFEENPQAEALLARLETLTTMSAEVQLSPQPLLFDYHCLAVPCAFLDGKKCSIYPVRPIVCSAYYAVSPQQYCRADSAVPAEILEIRPGEDSLRKLSQLADPRLSWHQEPLAEIVYKLLTRGLPEVSEEVFRLFESEERAQGNAHQGA